LRKDVLELLEVDSVVDVVFSGGLAGEELGEFAAKLKREGEYVAEVGRERRRKKRRRGSGSVGRRGTYVSKSMRVLATTWRSAE
jgi:hypothetical protein